MLAQGCQERPGTRSVSSSGILSHLEPWRVFKDNLVVILEIPCCVLFFLKCHSEVCEREGCGTLTSIFRVYALRVEMKPQVFRVSEPVRC